MILNTLRIQILSEFTGDYGRKITGSGFAKEKKLNQKSAANALLELEEAGFLKSKTEGKNKLYRLSLDDAGITTNLLSAIEHLRAIEFYRKNPLAKEVAEKMSPYCEGIVLIFGSYAKDVQKKDSDLDIFIAGKYQREEIEKISGSYRIKISVKCYPLNSFRESLLKKDYFIEEVMKNHIIIKGAQQFVDLVREAKHGKN